MNSKKMLERFTEVKRLAHFSEVKNFFNNCKEQFINISKWDKMKFFGHQNKILLYDDFGSEVDRSAKKGDYIKMDSKDELQVKSTFWFKIEELEEHKEHESEEHIYMTLRESEDPKLNVNGTTLSLAGKCELTLRRLIQTVSIDAKIHSHRDDFSESNEMNFIHNFKWDRLVKNMLFQL